MPSRPASPSLTCTHSGAARAPASASVLSTSPATSWSTQAARCHPFALSVPRMASMVAVVAMDAVASWPLCSASSLFLTVAVPADRSFDIMWCEALAEKISIFHDQAGKSRPLFVFYKGGKEIARINEANGERKCPHEPPNARPLQCCPMPLPAVWSSAHAGRFHPAELLPLFVRRQRAAAHSGRECGQEGVIIQYDSVEL